MRSKMISELVDDLARGRTVRLLGLPASGRTFVLQEVEAELRRRDVPTRLVRGVGGLSEMRLGTLVGNGIGADAGPSLTAVLARVQAQLAVEITPASVLLLDNLSEFDPVTLSVLSVVGARSGPGVLATDAVRPSARAQSAWAAVGRGGASLTLPPLGQPEVHALVLATLGAPVDQATVARITVATGGLPGIVLALLEETRRDGRLHQRRGVWRCVEPFRPEDVGGALAPLLASLGRREKHLARLAVAGPLRVNEARTLIGSRALHSLERAGVLHADDPGADTIVAIFPPLLATYLRGSLTPLARADLAADSASRLGAEDAPSAGIRAERSAWTVAADASVRVIPQLVHERKLTALPVFRAAWLADPRAAQARPYLSALHEVGADWAEVERVVAETVLTGDADEDVVVAAAGVIGRGYVEGDVAAATAETDRLRAAYPRFDGFLRGLLVQVRLSNGLDAGDDLLFDPGPDEAVLSVEAVRVARAIADVGRGRTASAMRAFLPGPLRSLSRNLTLTADATAVIARIMHGDVDAGGRLAAEGLNRARDELDLGALESYAYAYALALWMGDRGRDLAQHLATTLSPLAPPAMHRQYRMGMLTIAALEASRSGRREYARALTARVRAAGTVSGAFPAMLPELTTGILLSGEAPVAGGTVYGGLARDFAERGFVLHALVLVAIALAREERMVDLEWLEEVAAQVQSPALAMVARLPAAVASCDPEQLRELTAQLHDASFTLFGNIGAITAIRMLRAQGRRAEAATDAASLYERVRAHGGDVATVFAPLRADIDLSAREIEVARLLQSGLSNQSIADELVISARTVDNHVLNAYRKVGVDNRDDLAGALRTWLAER